jgi:hypothetical protein
LGAALATSDFPDGHRMDNLRKAHAVFPNCFLSSFHQGIVQPIGVGRHALLEVPASFRQNTLGLGAARGDLAVIGDPGTEARTT